MRFIKNIDAFAGNKLVNLFKFGPDQDFYKYYHVSGMTISGTRFVSYEIHVKFFSERYILDYENFEEKKILNLGGFEAKVSK